MNLVPTKHLSFWVSEMFFFVTKIISVEVMIKKKKKKHKMILVIYET